MDYFYKDISNIISEYVNGDKKYWKNIFYKGIRDIVDKPYRFYSLNGRIHTSQLFLKDLQHRKAGKIKRLFTE
jgi:hypothetical protein